MLIFIDIQCQVELLELVFDLRVKKEIMFIICISLERNYFFTGVVYHIKLV